ncbi:MAG: heme o synthase [Planctomycetota bacterium]
MSQISGQVLPGSQPGDRADLARSLVTLTKPGIVRLVAVTAMVGFTLSALGRDWSLGGLLLAVVSCLIGTSLAAAGANAANQAMEADRDALMPRTQDRPVPSGRVSRRAAMVFGLGLIAAGAIVLLVGASLAAAVVALLSAASYLAIYTPSKSRTPASTVIGAVPGALPPVIGWTAAAAASQGAGWSELADTGAWALFAIMFVWQVPHFMAIAWKYRGEYARGGFKVLPTIDPTGRRTSRSAIVWSVALLPAAWLVTLSMPRLVSPVSALLGSAAAVAMIWASVRLARELNDAAARRLFFVSIAYLPAVLFLFVGDALATTLR